MSFFFIFPKVFDILLILKKRSILEVFVFLRFLNILLNVCDSLNFINKLRGTPFPVNIYLFKVNNRTTRKSVKYAQS